MCKCYDKNYTGCYPSETTCCAYCALIIYAIIFYTESLIYFVVSNVFDYEYCYALYGLRLTVVTSCITATVYLYSGYNVRMFDYLSGSCTLVNIVIRILTIAGFSYCVAEKGAINDSNEVLSAMLSINVMVTAAIIIVFVSMMISMCFECAGNCLENEKKRQKEHTDELYKLNQEKEELERQKKLYEAKIDEIRVEVAKPVKADILEANIVKTE